MPHKSCHVVRIVADDVSHLEHFVANDVTSQLVGQLVEERARPGQPSHDYRAADHERRDES